MTSDAPDVERGPPRALILIGPPYTGFRTLRNALSKLAVCVDPDQQGDPISRLNALMLDAVGAAPHQLPSFAAPPKTRPANVVEWLRTTFAAEIDEALAGRGAPRSPVLLAGADFTLTAALWAEGFSRAGYDVHASVLLRSMDACARSLRRMTQKPLNEAVEIVQRFTATAVIHAPPEAVILRSERLFRAPAEELAGLAPGLSISDSDAALIRAAFTRRDTEQISTPPLKAPANPANRLAALVETAGSVAEVIEAAHLELARLFEEDVKSGAVYFLGPSAPARIGPPHIHRAGGRRDVIFHCHLFKNAGTSVDEILKHSFGARWRETEFPGHPSHSLADLTRSHILTRTDIDALSSHTGNWWFGYDNEALRVHPIIFVRHPLLRAESAYQFERKQTADTRGAKLARELDFPGYIAARLDFKQDGSFRNFQARRLAFFTRRSGLDVAVDARATLEQLPVIGLVEAFDASMFRFEARLQPIFPDFKAFSARKNVTSNGDQGHEERIARIREMLGKTLYDRFLSENAVDFAVHQEVLRRFA